MPNAADPEQPDVDHRLRRPAVSMKQNATSSASPPMMAASTIGLVQPMV